MAVSGGFIEKFNAGDRGFLVLTCKAAEALTAGQLVVLNGNAEREVEQADADEVLAKGVALQDCDAAADYIDVGFPGGVVYELVASGAVNAGQYLKSGAAGKVVGIAADGDPRLIVGYALTDAADGATTEAVLF